MVPVMFSAAQKALNCGNQVFISAGVVARRVLEHHPDAVDGELLALPSMMRVGAIRVTVPTGVVLPMAWSTCPCGECGRKEPYWY